MPESESNSLSPVAASAEALVVEWVRATRTVSLFPASNTRVQETVAEFVRVVEGLLAEQDSVSVTLQKDTVTIGEDVLDARPLPNIDWLKLRLDKSALAGLEFRSGFSHDSFIAFTEQLLNNWKRTDRNIQFENCWPEQYDGLELLDRRFDGAFQIRGDSEDGPTIRWSTATPQGRALAECLESSERIMVRMNRLQQKLEEYPVLSEGMRSIDLIGRLVNLLPADGKMNTTNIVDTIDEVLEGIENDLDMLADDQPRDMSLEQLVLRVSRKFFFREEQSALSPALDPETDGLPDELNPNVPEMLSGQISVQMDEDEESLRLIEKLRHMPNLGDRRFLDLYADQSQEQAGVLLQYLVTLADDELAERVASMVAPYFAQKDRSSDWLLRSHLAHARSIATRQGGDVPLRRMTAMIDAQPGLERAMRWLTYPEEQLIERFPDSLLQYIDSYDPANSDHVDELERICDRVGQARILASGVVLLDRDGLTSHHRASKILATPKRAFLPLVHLILQGGAESLRIRAITYLRELDLPGPEASLLQLDIDSEHLSFQYLFGLCGIEPDNSFPDDLRWITAEALCSFIESPEARGSNQEDRVHAIGLLGGLGNTPRALKLLQRLAGSRRWLGMFGVPARIRLAAEKALERFDESGGCHD